MDNIYGSLNKKNVTFLLVINNFNVLTFTGILERYSKIMFRDTARV